VAHKEWNFEANAVGLTSIEGSLFSRLAQLHSSTKVCYHHGKTGARNNIIRLQARSNVARGRFFYHKLRRMLLRDGLLRLGFVRKLGFE